VVRLAEDRGIAVAARNYGMAGYVNYQEVTLLSQLVTAGKRPDLVVFYDGTNDLAMALLDAVGGLNIEGEPGELGALQQRRALNASIDATSSEEPASPLREPPRRTRLTVDGLIDDAVGVYGQGLDLSRVLADRYGFRVVNFWQPDIYTKRPLAPGEQELLPKLGLDPFRYEAMTALSARARRALPAGVVDVSDALDPLSGSILSDSVHTNERGARAVAEAMFEHLAPDLQRLGANG
jgi:lysophospholipase L1-like esterase